MSYRWSFLSKLSLWTLFLAGLEAGCPRTAMADAELYRQAVLAEPSLIGFYPFDGDSGSRVTDRVPPAQDGVLAGATFSSAAGTVGTRSIEGARVDFGAVPEFEFSDGTGTVELFLYQTATAGYNPCFFSGRDNSGVRYSLHGDRNGEGLWIWNGSQALRQPTPVSMLDRLVHVAYVFDSGKVHVYFNGERLVTWDIALGAGVNRPFQLGASTPSNSEAWPGRMDELAIYADALDADTIAAHYQAFQYLPHGVLREVYRGIQGTRVADLLESPAFPDSPTEVSFETDGFQAPSNAGENFGQRLSAYVVPPQTGSYRFWISSADASELWLGATPLQRQRIAYVSQATAPDEWTREPNQASAPIVLQSGRRYYLEAVMKAGQGPDHLQVRWQLPDGTIESPIPNTRLEPFGFDPPLIVTQPVDLSVVVGEPATFEVEVFRKAGVRFQWQRDGVDIPGATTNVYTLAAVSPADDQARFRCVLANAYGTNITRTATLTVLPDSFPPEIVAVASEGTRVVRITFNEALALSALDPAHFSIDQGIEVLRAAFGTQSNEVILTTTPLTPEQDYTLTVSEVEDLYGNVIAPRTEVSFRPGLYEPLPLEMVRPMPEPPGPATRRGPFIISEIMYHPTNRTDGRNLEFIEIYNSQIWDEELGGFRLSGEVDYTFPPDTVIPAQGYLVVAPAPEDVAAVYGLDNVLGGFTNRLNNAGGVLRLIDAAGAVVFEVEYDTEPPWPVAADGTGHSLVLARPSLGMNNPHAWDISRELGGSPGRAEPVPAPDALQPVMINEWLANPNPPDEDFVELFNYSSQAVDVSGWFLSDEPDTNKFEIPPGTVLAPRGFVTFARSQLGFGLRAEGETLFLKDAAGRVVDAIKFGGQGRGIASGRTPDGAPTWSPLVEPTPGAANALRRIPPVVINEIMYHPISQADEEEFIELYNHSAVPVDVSGWRLRGGVQFTIPQGTVMPAGGYLVIAADAERLMSMYPALGPQNTVGNFKGRLSNRGEPIVLEALEQTVTTNGLQLATNTVHVAVCEVTYGTGGRWGRWHDGDGSSLELRDPRADLRLPASWADSNETGKSDWTTVEWTGVLDHGQATPDRVQILLFGVGECLVDDVEVLIGSGENLVANPDFEQGATGWRMQGSYHASRVETGVGVGGSKALHVVAASRGDTGANRIQGNLTRTISAGQVVTLRAKVRWLAGNPEFLLRLRGGWLEAAGWTPTTSAFGTPGTRNSAWQPDAGPAITEVRHRPVLPQAGETVTITARIDDPDGVAGAVLFYRRDPSASSLSVPMVFRGAGWYSAEIPPQIAGTLVAFHIRATDTAGAQSIFPSDAPAHECLVRWGDPEVPGRLGVYRMWMTQATRSTWESREKNSNEPLDVTFVYGDFRAIYNAGAMYSGSPFHTPGFTGPLGTPCDYDLRVPKDDRFLGETDLNIVGPGTFGDDPTLQREQTLWWKMRRMGGPAIHRRFVYLYINGTRRQKIFEDTQQPNRECIREWFPEDDEGQLFKAQDWIEFADDGATFLSLQRAVLGKFVTRDGSLKPTPYRWMWAPRSVRGSALDLTNLFTLVQAMNLSDEDLYTVQTEMLADPESISRALALHRIVGNWDSWGWSFGKNMYLYKPLHGRCAMIPWDLDFSYGLNIGDPAPSAGGLFSNASNYAPNAPGDPVATRFRNNPTFRRAYWRAFEAAVNGPMRADVLAARVQKVYAALQAEGLSPSSPNPILSYSQRQRDFILSQMNAVVNASFALLSPPGPVFTTDQDTVLLQGNAPITVHSIRVNGRAYPLKWTTATAWSIRVPLQPGLNVLTVQGYDAQGNPLPMATATLSVQCNAEPASPLDQIVFNEIMYHPAYGDGQFIELFNRSARTFDLSGWVLDGLDYVFPDGTILTNGQYMVVARDRFAFLNLFGVDTPVAGDYAGRLDSSADVLTLLAPLGGGVTSVVDRVRYEAGRPWPASIQDQRLSLQLMDPSRDNSRVSAWTDGAGWRFFTFTAPVSDSRVSLFFDSQGGDLFLDGLVLVQGNQAGVGENLLANGDFEQPLEEGWGISSLAADSHRTNGLAASGQYGLHLVQSPGAPRTTTFYQTLGTVLPRGTVCTLSGWYMPGSSGATFTIRIGTTFQFRPSLEKAGPTPGAPNFGTSFLPPYPPVWINEVQPQNVAGPTDGAGEHEPWIEIYNAGSEPVLLDGLYLSDNYAALGQWPFPAGTSLAPGGFLLVWADGETGESTPTELHAGFRLAPQQGSVVLSRQVGGTLQILDYINYSEAQPDESIGALPDGQPFERPRSARPTPGAPNVWQSPAPPLRINEWMAANRSQVRDPADRDPEDWFEIYNAGETAVDLGGYSITDDLTQPGKFVVPGPNRYIVPPKGFLIVWADGEPEQNNPQTPALHVNFKLRQAGESLALFDRAGQLVDQVTFGPQLDDVTEGRYPDGADAVHRLAVPTPGLPNRLDAGPPPPRFTSWRVGTEGNVEFSFQTMPGFTYQVEYTQDLNSGAWTALGVPRTATSTNLSVQDTIADQAQRFYRIVVLP